MKIILFLYCFLFLGCSEKNQKQSEKNEAKELIQSSVVYNFEKPDVLWELPIQLNEISGMSLLNDSVMICQEDEHGKIYLFNLQSFKIDNISTFAKASDYEDLALVANTVFLLQSNGTIVTVDDYLEKPVVKKYKSFLSKENDTEGLCYDSVTNSLFIACKEKQKSNTGDDELKNIYQFQIGTGSISEKPILSFKDKNCKPSAIAIHPFSKNLFVLSSSKTKLLEVNRNGVVVTTYELKKKLFQQPEGLTFAKNGDLYISNEADGGTATILLFHYLNK